MRASFFCTSSKSPSGWPNWRRVRACSAARRRARLGHARAAGAESGAAEIEHRQRHLQPFAHGPRMFSLGDAHVLEGEPRGGRAADAELLHPRLDDAEARHVGRDEKGGHGVSSRPGTGVRAMTVSTSAMAPLVM